MLELESDSVKLKDIKSTSKKSLVSKNNDLEKKETMKIILFLIA
jgi:hypothetical protein